MFRCIYSRTCRHPKVFKVRDCARANENPGVEKLAEGNFLLAVTATISRSARHWPGGKFARQGWRRTVSKVARVTESRLACKQTANHNKTLGNAVRMPCLFCRMGSFSLALRPTLLLSVVELGRVTYPRYVTLTVRSQEVVFFFFWRGRRF